VTFAFGDPSEQVYGVARVGRADGAGSGLAVLFSGTAVVAVSAEGGVEAGGPRWEDVDAAGITCTVDEPLRSWGVRFDGGDDGGFELAFEARSSPAVLEAGQPAARAGGMEGYEQLCSVSGTVRVGERTVPVRCLGQRGHQWGTPDWERIELARTLTAWLGEDRAVVLSSVRSTGARSHLDEAVAAWVLQDGEPVAVAEPRLSTTYDGGLRQRRAGLELWLDAPDDPDDTDAIFARRIAGELVCGTSLDLGRLRLDTAFFAWRMEGREGVGRYDVLRHAPPEPEPAPDSAAASASAPA
jgi:hypothetical protein